MMARLDGIAIAVPRLLLTWLSRNLYGDAWNRGTDVWNRGTKKPRRHRRGFLFQSILASNTKV